jgi:hypothetical protein
MMMDMVFAAAGFGVGVFCPAVAREVKSWFSKEATVAKTAATSVVSGAVSAEVKKL